MKGHFVRISLVCVLLACSSCGTGNALTQADICFKTAYDDYRVIKDQNFTAPVGERTATKMIAKENFLKKTRECEIRYGKPVNLPDAPKWSVEVFGDESW